MTRGRLAAIASRTVGRRLDLEPEAAPSADNTTGTVLRVNAGGMVVRLRGITVRDVRAEHVRVFLD